MVFENSFLSGGTFESFELLAESLLVQNSSKVHLSELCFILTSLFFTTLDLIIKKTKERKISLLALDL